MQSETWLNLVLLVFLSIQEGGEKKEEKVCLAKFISLNKYVEVFILDVNFVAVAHFCKVV